MTRVVEDTIDIDMTIKSYNKLFTKLYLYLYLSSIINKYIRLFL